MPAPAPRDALSHYIKRRGLCALCGVALSVNADGKPRKHPDKRPNGHNSWCGGHTIAAFPLPSQATIPGA